MPTSVQGIIHQVDYLVHYYPAPEKKGKIKIIGVAPDESFPYGYFDGAAAESQGGAGIYIAINSTHLLAFKIGCGPSMNTRAELLALWTLLFVSIEMGIPIKHIYGDSSIIINWENNKAALSFINMLTKETLEGVPECFSLLPPILQF